MKISKQFNMILILFIPLGCFSSELLSMGPCFSDLNLASLEACEVDVLNNLVVDGQIINECCEGNRETGPTGATGATGSQGPPGSDAISRNSLYASLIDAVSPPILLAGDEAIVPLNIIFTDEWALVDSSNIAFECPSDGLYQVAYELFPFLEFIFPFPTTAYDVSAWIELLGGVPIEIEGSRVQVTEQQGIFFLPFTQFETQLSNVFLVELSAGDQLQLKFSSKGAPSGLAVSLPTSGVAANLVVTKIA